MLGVLELADVGEQLVPGGRRGRDPGLREERLVVPEADHPEVVRDAVLLAVDLVDAHGSGIHGVRPVRDVGGDVLDEAGRDLLGETAAAPRLEDVRRGAGLHRGRDLGLERLVLEDRLIDGHVGMRRHVLAREGLEQRLARIVDLEVPPLDGDGLGRGLRWRRLRHSVRPPMGRCSAAALGLAPPPPLHAASTMATMARSPNRRRCIDTDSPSCHKSVLPHVPGAVRSRSPPRRTGSPRLRPLRVSSLRKFRAIGDCFRPRTLRTGVGRVKTRTHASRNWWATGPKLSSSTVVHDELDAATASHVDPIGPRSRHRQAGRRVRADGLEGDQRPIRRVARDPASGSRRPSASTAISAIRPLHAGGPDPRADLPRARQ